MIYKHVFKIIDNIKLKYNMSMKGFRLHSPQWPTSITYRGAAAPFRHHLDYLLYVNRLLYIRAPQALSILHAQLRVLKITRIFYKNLQNISIIAKI